MEKSEIFGLSGLEKIMDTKILLLEDDIMLNEGIAYALRKKGYLVYCAENIKHKGSVGISG